MAGAIVRAIAMLTTEVMMTPRTLNNPSKTDDQDYGQCGSGGEIGLKKGIDWMTGMMHDETMEGCVVAVFVLFEGTVFSGSVPTPQL